MRQHKVLCSGHHDIQHNDTQHNDNQLKGLICDTQNKGSTAQQNSVWRAIMLSLVMLSVVMLNVVMLSAIMLMLLC